MWLSREARWKHQKVYQHRPFESVWKIQISKLAGMGFVHKIPAFDNYGYYNSLIILLHPNCVVSLGSFIWLGSVFIYQYRAKRGRSLEILYRDLFMNAWRYACVRLSPHSPPTPVKLEAWKLPCTRMAPKLPIRFLIFCQEAEIFKYKVLYLCLY